MRIFTIAIAVLSGTGLIHAAPYADDARAIVEKSLAAEDRSDKVAIDYTYKARDVTKELDGRGNVKTSRTTVSEVVYLGGKLVRHVIEKDGKPLAGDELKKEQAKFDRAVDEASKLTDADKQRRRREELDKRRKNFEQRKVVPQAFDLSLLREDKVAGRPAWVIHATPRQDFHGKYANIMRNMEGDIWIDKADYRWAKITAHALDSFSLGLVLARIGKDTEINFELALINGEVWLPKHVSVHADARIAIFKKVNVEQEIFFSDYRKYTSDSRIVETAGQQ